MAARLREAVGSATAVPVISSQSLSQEEPTGEMPRTPPIYSYTDSLIDDEFDTSSAAAEQDPTLQPPQLKHPRLTPTPPLTSATAVADEEDQEEGRKTPADTPLSLSRQKTLCSSSTPLLSRSDSYNGGGGDECSELFDLYRMMVASHEQCGPRAFMQDAHIVIPDLHSFVVTTSTSSSPSITPMKHQYSLFGVFDGHAGDRAAKYVAEHLPRVLHARLNTAEHETADPQHTTTTTTNNEEDAIVRAIKEAFTETDEQLLKEANDSLVKWKDGCTANVILMVDGTTLYIGNIGDSRSVLGTVTGFKELSKDHVPWDPVEKARIEAAGGYVTNNRVLGRMDISRSFGDVQFKQCGVISVPDVVVHEINRETDRFVVMGSDGLFKVMTCEAVVEFAKNCMSTESQQERNDATVLQTAAVALIKEALDKHTNDNVTIIAILFPHSADLSSSLSANN